jgi:hypothetical protein
MQYYAATCVLMAIEDVLRGPEGLHGMIGTRTLVEVGLPVDGVVLVHPGHVPHGRPGQGDGRVPGLGGAQACARDRTCTAAGTPTTTAGGCA